MEPSIFGYIRKYSWRQQLIVLAMTLVSLPFFYASLELPKLIINDALSDLEGMRTLFWLEMEQLDFLFLLCGLFLALVLINGGFKYLINVYKGILGERMLRRLRYELYSRVLRFPLPHFRRISQGELVQMINAEVEPLGGFIGDAYSLPAYQGGMLLTILAFMFIQDPIMGLAAVFLYPLQVWIIPKLQRQVNLLGKARVRQVRRLAERIGETSQGVRDIRANDATQHERARFTHELGIIFHIRFDIYKKKFFIKFLNNFLAQLGPFFFYLIGGYLVIQGELTIGALVAVIAAHEKLSAPWKELLTYYQFMSDARIKYDQVVSQFDPDGIRDEALQAGEPEEMSFEGPLRISNLTLNDDDGEPIIQAASASLDLPSRVAVIGSSGSGKEELMLMLSGLLEPSRGRILLNDRSIHELNDATIGRRAGYVGNPVQIMSGTIEDNLFFGLKHRPVIDLTAEHKLGVSQKELVLEAERSGNSTLDPNDEWVDFEALGLTDPETRRHHIVRILKIVALDGDVYAMGLRSSLKGDRFDGLRESFLSMRALIEAELSQDRSLARLVERFDPEAFNSNATVAENLLFGTPDGDVFDEENLQDQPYVIETLEKTGLLEEFHVIGYKLAQTMVEIFSDLPPDHEYFSQFSFISAEDLPEFKTIIARTNAEQLDQLAADQRQKLLSLPFKLITNRHRLGLIDDGLQAKIVEARRYFRQNLPEDLKGSIDFFDPAEYNGAASVLDNILFGKIVTGQAQAQEKMLARVNELLAANQLDDEVIEVGLATECGVNGSRLNVVQRQKLGFARVLMKDPEILLLYDPIGPLDSREQETVRDRVLEAYRERTVIWALQQDSWVTHFDSAIRLQSGRIVEQGKLEDLRAQGGEISRLLAPVNGEE